jgi:hypothetical protein
MSLAVLADHMASKGRNGDSMLVHMTPDEVRGLHALAEAHGGGLTINPETGLPEASFLKRILPMIAGMALNAFLPGVGTAIGSALGGLSGAVGTGILVGGVTGLAKGSLKEGILAGLGAYGGASLASGFAAAGEAGVQQAVGQAAVKDAVSEAALKEAAAAIPEQVAAKTAAMTPYDKIAAGVSNLGTEAGRQNLMASFGGASGAGGISNLGRTAALAMSPVIADAMVPTNVQMPSLTQNRGMYRGYTYDPYGGTYIAQEPVRAASGGIVALADGGATREEVLQAYRTNPGAELNPNEEAINYWMGQGLGSFNDVVSQTRAGNPALAQQIDATRTAATTQQFATPASTLPNYLGLNAVAAGQPGGQTVISGTAGPGYNYAPATLQTDREKDINQIYRDVLGREAEQEGLSYWAGTNLGIPEIKRQIQSVGSNIGVAVDPTQLATPTAAQLAAQQSIFKDPQAAAIGIARSGVAQGLSDQQIADLVNQTYGKSFSAQNVADFMAANNITRPKPVVPYTPPDLFTDVPGVAPGTAVTGAPAVDYTTAPTMGEVKSAYEQGGGATKMPVITDIKPTDRTYTQNEAFSLLQGYLKSNPNAPYGDVVAFARGKGIPEMQARAAYNEFRFSGLTGGSLQAYDYLMGRGAYPVKPFTPTGELMRPYAEAVLGAPENIKAKRLIFDPKTQRYVKNPEFVERTPSTANAPIRDQAGNPVGSNTESYFKANPDVYQEWLKGTTGMTADAYARFHWETFGQKEGRKGWSATPAGGGRTGGTDTGTGGNKAGGLMDIASAAARGGNVQQYNLGGYSDGGRLLRGPGDGVSDSIPATIGNRQPARLADGEFVIPARIVSEIGNGSTEAGARKLYAMMDRVQRARAKTTGKGKVAKNTKSEQYLPA